MTFVVTLLFGFGVVLIASALDGSPVVVTFLKVLHGQPVNWSGQGQKQGETKPSSAPKKAA